MIYFILSPEKKIAAYRQLPVFSQTNRFSNKAGLLYKKFKKNNPAKSFEDWFHENSYFEELIDLQLELDELIDIPHYIGYLKFRALYDRTIIWIDNIDAFSNIQQTQIVTILQNIQKNILNSSQLVVSVREENIYRVGKFSDNFNEPFMSKVTFEDPDRTKHFNEYGAVNVPVMTLPQLSELTQKKLKFTYRKYKQFETPLYLKIGKHRNYMEDLREKNIAKYNIDYKDLIEIKKEIEYDHRIHNLAELSNLQFQSLLKLSEKVVNSFDEEKVIFLSNNSIKEYLRIHSDFILNLISSDIYGDTGIDFAKLSTPKIVTNFLSWIYNVDASYGIETFNVIEEIGKIQTDDTNQKIGCFLPYVVLTKIWNECINLNGRPSPKNNPFVKDIIRRIKKDFGYSKAEIKKTLFSLYKHAGGKGSFITFRTKKTIKSAEDIELNTTVRITYRGRITLGHTINSFGYLKECSLRLHPNEDIDSNERLVLSKLATISEIHLNSLISIREKMFRNSQNWYRKYLAKYGIPMDARFVRNDKLGNNIPNIAYNRCLYLETVFDSLGRYFRIENNFKKELNRIINQFNKNLFEIVSGGSPQIKIVKDE